MRSTVRIQNYYTLDVRRLLEIIRSELRIEDKKEFVKILSGVSLNGHRLQYEMVPRGFIQQEIRVICPECGRFCFKLVFVEGGFGCRRWEKVAAPARCRRRQTSEAYLLRPLRLIALYETRLQDPALIPRQRSILTNKMKQMQAAIGEGIVWVSRVRGWNLHGDAAFLAATELP